jgi:tRNA pseudouridine38-40 synthase
MRTLKITLQYDGTDYVGWQRQATGTSIQGLIEDSLEPIAGTRITVHGAGRTDSGVHALGQVASVTFPGTLETGVLARALNAVLPRDVRVLTIDEMPADFHARFSAVAKTYEYRIVNALIVSPFLVRYVWHVTQQLDVEAMKAAAAHLIGTHDFAAFRAAGSDVDSTQRTIHSMRWQDGGGYDAPMSIHLKGSGFLRHMVRNIVGTLVEVGSGRWAPEQVADILASKDRARGGATAPAHGLFLVGVDY